MPFARFARRLSACLAVTVSALACGPAWGLNYPEPQGKTVFVDAVPDYHLFNAWVPDNIPVFRLLWVQDNVDSGTWACPANVARILKAVVLNVPDNLRRFNIDRDPVNKDQFLAYLDGLAKKTGHPELVNCPMIWDGQWGPEIVGPWFPDRIVCFRAVFSYWDNADVPQIRNPEETRQRMPDGAWDDFVNGMVGMRSKGDPITMAPQWGWGHGFYSMQDVVYPFFEQCIKARVPADWDPLKGKPALRHVPDAETWLGDPDSWYGEWPLAYAYGQYPKDKSKGQWQPNAYQAAVWRAYVSRHPTLTNQTSNWGNKHNGGSGGSFLSMSAPPSIAITTPIRPYDLDKIGGANYPVVPRDTVMTLGTGPVGYDSIVKVQLYEGDRLVAELAHNALNIYNFTGVKMSTPGIRSFYVTALQQSGKQIVGRPATIFVSEQPGTTAIGPRRGSRASRFPAHGLQPRDAAGRALPSERVFLVPLGG